MKRLLFVLILLLFPASVFAAPFLTCDCTPAADLVTSFQLQFDTAAWIDTTAVLTCGSGTDKVTCTGDSKTICYDLASVSVGAHTVKARAINAWESSADSSPFSFTKGSKPSYPSLLRVVK